MTILRLLTGAQARAAIPALCDVLADCVEGGASVGFMQPYTAADAEPYWQGVAEQAEAGTTLLMIAETDGEIVGTVQVGVAQMPNQPHRGDLKKLLVHRKARGLGLGRLLMTAIEQEAAKAGKTLLVLDTATGSPAESIYPRLGWTRVGVIPDYAMWPEGGFCPTTIFYKHLSGLV
ncbi:GNAT family N-acetyltransferase [Rhizobium sp. LjRoot30]|uniref:GNAT family N-acetyltransferase n=1 Tax=Rhizobium sp. LjRoot30 TaxID=3342320 RepID=UPI003ED110F0